MNIIYKCIKYCNISCVPPSSYREFGDKKKKKTIEFTSNPKTFHATGQFHNETVTRVLIMRINLYSAYVHTSETI